MTEKYLNEAELEKIERHRVTKELRDVEAELLRQRQARVEDARRYFELKIMSLKIEENQIRDDLAASRDRALADAREREGTMAAVRRRLELPPGRFGYDPETMKVILDDEPAV